MNICQKTTDGAFDLIVDELQVNEVADFKKDAIHEADILLESNDNILTISASDTLEASIPLILPPNIGMGGYTLLTDGFGNTSWGSTVSYIAISVPSQLLINGGSSASTTTTATFNIELNSPTGTGNLVLSTNPTLTNPTFINLSTLNISSLSPSQAVATDALKNLVSVPNTGSGNNVLSTSPTLVTPTLGVASATSLKVTGLQSSSSVATDESKNLISVPNTGSGNNVLATSPTIQNLNITGDSQFLGNIDIGSIAQPGSLDVFGPVKFYQDVQIGDLSAFPPNYANLSISGDLSVQSTITFGTTGTIPILCNFSVNGITTLTGSLGLGDDCLITGDVVLSRETLPPFTPVAVKGISAGLSVQWLLGYSTTDLRYQLKISDLAFTYFTRIRSDSVTITSAASQTIVDANSFGILDTLGANYFMFMGLDSTSGQYVLENYGPLSQTSLDSNSLSILDGTGTTFRQFIGFDSTALKYVHEIYDPNPGPTGGQSSLDANSLSFLDASGVTFRQFMGYDSTSVKYVYEIYDPSPGPTGGQTSLDANSLSFLDVSGTTFRSFFGLDTTELRHVLEIYGLDVSMSIKSDSIFFSTSFGSPLATISMPTPAGFSISSFVPTSITSTTGLTLTTAAGAMSLSGGVGGVAISSGAGLLALSAGAGAITLSTLSGGIALSAGSGALALTAGVGALAITGGAGGIAISSGAGVLALSTGAGAMTLSGGVGGIAISSGAGALALSTGVGIMSLTTGIGGCTISTGVGALALTTGTGVLALTTGLGALTLTTAGGVLTTNTFAGDTSFATTLGSIKMTCGSGNAEVSSTSGAVNIFGQGGGVNIGTNTVFCGHLIVHTRNGITSPQTGSIEFYTHTDAEYTGNGDFSVNTLDAYRGRCQFDIKEDFIIKAANVNVNNLTASQIVATDSFKNLVSIETIGTGDIILSTDPTFSGVVSFDSTTEIQVDSSTTTGGRLTITSNLLEIRDAITNFKISSLTEILVDAPSIVGGRLAITSNSFEVRDALTNFQLSSATNLRIDSPSTPNGRLLISSSSFEIGTAITSVKVNYLTASQSIATDASKNLVSIPNTGTGNNVLATSPTLITPNIGVAVSTGLQMQNLSPSAAIATNAGRNLVSVTNTGTGNNVLSTSPVLTTPSLGNAAATRIYISANAGLFGYIRSNNNEFFSTTSLNPGIVVYRADTGNAFGFDCGFNGIYSSRIFSPPTASFVYATHNAGVLPTLQSSFTNRFIVTGSGVVNIPNLTESQSIATDASKNLVSIPNTGSGNNVLSTSPSFSGNVDFDSTSTITINAPLTPGGRLLISSSSFEIGPAITNVKIDYLSGYNVITTDIDGNLIAVQNTGTGENVLATSPVFSTSIILNGTTSGAITISSTTGSYNFILPNNAGTSGQVLTSNGTSTLWTTLGPGGSGTVTSVDITVPSILSVTGGPITTSGTLNITTAVAPTGTGSIVLSTSPSFSGIVDFDSTSTITINAPLTPGGRLLISSSSFEIGTAITSLRVNYLTASQSVATDASKNLVSVPNTGTGNNVLSTSPSFSGSIDFDSTATLTINAPFAPAGRLFISASSFELGTSITSLRVNYLTASRAVATDGSKNLISIANTGTNNNVLSTSPTITTPTIVDRINFTSSPSFIFTNTTQCLQFSDGSGVVTNTRMLKVDSDQTVPNNSATVIFWGSVVRSSGSALVNSSGRLTNNLGRQIAVTVSYTAKRGTSGFGITAFWIETSFTTERFAACDVGANDKASGTCTVLLNNSDFFEVKTFQNSGSGQTYFAGEQFLTYTFL